MKLEKIRDWDGEVAGYKLGDYELVKYYYYGNQYGWKIQRAYTVGVVKEKEFVEHVLSCKKGKERLVELAG